VGSVVRQRAAFFSVVRSLIPYPLFLKLGNDFSQGKLCQWLGTMMEKIGRDPAFLLARVCRKKAGYNMRRGFCGFISPPLPFG